MPPKEELERMILKLFAATGQQLTPSQATAQLRAEAGKGGPPSITTQHVRRVLETLTRSEVLVRERVQGHLRALVYYKASETLNRTARTEALLEYTSRRTAASAILEAVLELSHLRGLYDEAVIRAELRRLVSRLTP